MYEESTVAYKNEKNELGHVMQIVNDRQIKMYQDNTFGKKKKKD